MDVNRRNFLTGALTTTAAGLLVKATTPGIEAFAPQPDEAVTLIRPNSPSVLYSGVMVFDGYGHPLGFITKVDHEYDQMDVSQARDGSTRRFENGFHRATYLTVQVSGAYVANHCAQTGVLVQEGEKVSIGWSGHITSVTTSLQTPKG